MRPSSWWFRRCGGCLFIAVLLISQSTSNDSRVGCGDERLSLDALAARRGLTRAEADRLLAYGFTPYTLCTARDRIIQKGLRITGAPAPSFPGEYIRWRNLSLMDENGVIDPNGLMRAKGHVDMMRAMLPAGASAAGINRGSWRSLGPGNIGGRIRALVIDPNNPNVMVLGATSGGIWRTTNGGSSWTVSDDFMANLAVSSLVMQPGNSNVLYAGTGEGWGNTQVIGAGVFKSTDGGVTWTQLAATSTNPGAGMTAADFRSINRLAMSPNGSTLLVAAAGGIFRSTDGGATFTRAVAGGAPITGRIADVDFHPTNNNRAVAGGFVGNALYSLDGGITWLTAAGMPGAFGRVETAIAPSDGNTIYAGVDLDDGSLYKSTNGGVSYTEVFDGANDALNPYNAGAGGQGWYDNLVWVSPADPNFVVWGGIDLFRSTNGGSAFSRMSEWFSHNFEMPTSAHADQHIAVAHPNFNGTTNRIVYFGNDGGIYRADDVATVGGGASPFQSGWTELNNGLAITQFYGAAGHPATGRLTGGTQDNGTLFFNPALSNPTETWVETQQGDGGFSAYDSADGNFFYGEYIYLQVNRNVLVRSNGIAAGSNFIHQGPSAAARLTDAANPATSLFIAPLLLDPNSNDRLLGGGLRLWRSNDPKSSVPSWENIKDPVVAGDHVSAIAVVPGNSNIIYVGHISGQLFKTTTATASAAAVRASWVALDNNGATDPLPDRYLQRITIDPANVDTIYVTFGGFAGDNIYRSTDGGATWADITGPTGGATAMPDVPVRDLDVHPGNSNFLYAGTEVGIFTSGDRGATWTLPHDGPSNAPVDELFFLGSTLYAVTHGRGIFVTGTSTAPPIAANDSFAVNFNTTLTVAAPGVLGNDNPNGTLAMTAALVSNPTNGTLTFSADGSFVYVPNAGFEGTDTFTYRATNSAGASNVATVSIFIVPRVPRPEALVAVVSGNSVTFTWSDGSGLLTPDRYQLEAGISATALTTVLPIGNTRTFTVGNAPDGIFFVRVRALAGALVGQPSSVIEVRIGSAALPGSATNLLASASGSTVSMAWMPPEFGGTVLRYDVRASATAGGSPFAVLPVPSGQTLVSVPGAPPGTYFITIAAVSGAGSAPASNEVAVTVPGTCTPPRAVQNLRNLGSGSNVALRWDLPAAGSAPTGFRVEAGLSSGASNAAIITTPALALQASAPAGTYFVRVLALNQCGASPASSELRIVVP